MGMGFGVFALGVLLWGQIFVLSSGFGAWVLGAALGVLGLGVWARSEVGLFLGFLLLLGLGLVWVDTPILREAGVWVRIAATLAAWLVVAGGWCSQGGKAVLWAGRGWMARYWLGRGLLMALLLLVPVYALHMDAVVVSTLGQHYGEESSTGMIFISTLMFFVWCGVSYTQIILPALNLEYDRRRLMRDLGRMRVQGWRRWVHVGWQCGLALLIAGALLM